MTMTQNPPATIDDDAYTVRRTVSIAAPPERVWAAITEPQHIARWFGDRAELPGTEVGTDGRFGFEGFGDVPVRVEAADPPRSIAYRWGARVDAGAAYDESVFARSTVFRFTLEATDEGTRLTVVETGFDGLEDPAARMADNRQGWTEELDELVAYLEGA